jgi:hypothetical protein
MRKIPVDQSQPDMLEKVPKFRIAGCAVPPVHVRYSMFFKWLRQQEHHWHQKRTEWVLRHEHGELNERPHFHFLIRGLPKGANTGHMRIAAMNRWEKLGGGMARIRPFADTFQDKSGRHGVVQYVMKSRGANAYELSKFELEESEIRLSPALLEYLEARNQRITFKADLGKA